MSFGKWLALYLLEKNLECFGLNRTRVHKIPTQALYQLDYKHYLHFLKLRSIIEYDSISVSCSLVKNKGNKVTILPLCQCTRNLFCDLTPHAAAIFRRLWRGR